LYLKSSKEKLFVKKQKGKTRKTYQNINEHGFHYILYMIGKIMSKDEDLESTVLLT